MHCGVHYLWFAFVCFLIRSHPPPPGAVPGQQGRFLPPSAPQKRAQRVGGKRIGQPRHPMQTLCDEVRVRVSLRVTELVEPVLVL